ncbi:MAG TPA: ATP-binding protein [Parasegetibacter sp.]
MPLSSLKPIRVLIVDDDEDDFFITSEYINQITNARFEMEWCFKYNEALQRMLNKQYDIYLVDYRLGIKTGLDLLKEAINNNVEEPIILLTGKGSQSVDREAMQVGAVDYLVKTELNSEKLERCIRYAIDRADAIKALKAKERKYRSIFEQSKDAVFLAGSDLVFKDVNNATLDLLGCTTEEVLHHSLYDFLTEHSSSDYVRHKMRENKEVDDLEIELRNKKGETRYCILSASFIPEITDVIYVQGIIHDITNLKRAEKATLQAEKLASAGRLVRTLAHEVRNPLNNINLSIEQLQHAEAVDSDHDQYMDIILRNSNRISALINELLQSSKPAEIIMEKVSLQSVLDESISSALDRVTLKKINMKIHYPNEEIWIMADREKLKIAFLNIIINAVEAMKEGDGMLNILLWESNDEYRVQIKDNGSGISEENLGKLFEPYFTSKRNGMGLGLASTLNILRSHKATIEVDSEIGSGTTFTISFSRIS